MSDPSYWRSSASVAAALAYTAFLYATLPLAPDVWTWLLPRLQPHVTSWFLMTGGAAVLALAVPAWRASPANRAWRLGVLLAVSMAYAAALLSLYQADAPAKKAHLIMYGGLGYVALNAVRVEPWGGKGLRGGLVYLALAGVVDEIIQAILPMRFFSLRDILANWLGASLGCLTWLAASSRSPWSPSTKSRTAPPGR